jgi:hypothetical protein
MTSFKFVCKKLRREIYNALKGILVGQYVSLIFNGIIVEYTFFKGQSWP